MKAMLTGIAKGLQIYNQPETKIFFTDDVKHEKNMIEEALPSLKKAVEQKAKDNRYSDIPVILTVEQFFSSCQILAQSNT